MSKKLTGIFFSAFIIFVIGLSPVVVQAANVWIETATITEIGPSPTGPKVFIKVQSDSEGITTPITMEFPSNVQNEMLAVALTAMSIGSTVRLRYDDAHTTTFPQPDRFYLNAQ